MTTQSAVCPLHVGRAREVALLAPALERRAMTLIAGEAGLGKSRLASEAMRLADEHGLSQLVGHCRADPTVPYLPFVTAIRRRTRTLGGEDLARLFDGSALLAAALLPEAATAAGLPKEQPDQEDLFAAVWQLLSRLAAPRGCLLLLEDLHWADRDSLRLLSYLAREMADLDLWLLGTYRSDELHRRHPLTACLAELGRERRYDEIRLAPLGRDDVGEMVSAIFDGTEVSGELVDALLERTGGNPFFVEELVKVLVERGDIYRQAGDWAERDLSDIEMPITFRETLVARAHTLGEGALEVLQLAALSGEHIELPVLAAAAGMDQAGVEDVVREGLRLQLLVERREGPRLSYAFRHALTREAFADELVGPDRQRAHRRIAEAMAAVHGTGLGAVAAELADHFAEAGEAERAIEFGTRAARRAAASGAPEEAGRRYERTLRLLPRGAGERLPLLLEAAEATIEGPNRRLAVAFATEAREHALLASDPLAEGRALMTLQRDAWNGGDTPRALSLIGEALALIRGRDDKEEARVCAGLTRMLTLAGRQAEAAELLPEGIELATRSGNLQALSLMHGTRMLQAEEDAEFDDSFRAAVAAAREGNDEYAERNCTCNAGFIALWRGDLLRSRESFLRAMALSERFAPHERYPEAGYAWLLSLLGEYEEASSRSAQLAGSAAIPSRFVALTARYEVAERRGEAEAAAILDELWSISLRTGEAQRSVPALAARARHALLQAGVEASAPLFWEALAMTRTSRGTGSHWMFSPDLARVLADEEQVGELERWGEAVHRLTCGDPHMHNRAADVLVSAYLSASQGELAAARELFDDAARRFRAMPCPAREAEALIGLADLEWRADRLEASASAGRRALEIAEGTGARAVAERASQAVSRAEPPPALVTVLFTDIVGSTERVSALGDRAWRSLLERHNTLVRRELARWNGREVVTTGDGFLAAFDAPAQGLRCALALRDVLAAAGIQIRAGLHTGECQVTGADLAGIAVHIAARVSAAAAPGEVLVSGTVRDLVAGSPFSFRDRGRHRLKGVPGEWQLLAVSR